MGISDIWDSISEFFGGITESATEFSTWGILGAIGGLAWTFFTSSWVLSSFTKYMSPLQALFWTVITYLASAEAGYLIMNHMMGDS